MITWKQHLLNEKSIKKIAQSDFQLNDININVGDIYYTDINNNLHNMRGPAITKDKVRYWFKHGKLHREKGPAIYDLQGLNVWWIEGERVDDFLSEKFKDYKWILLRGNPDNIRAFPNTADKEMQEYVIKHSPDLIGEINNLDPELKEKYKYQLELYGKKK